MFLPLFWARIYGCLNSVEKLRSVSPTHNNEEMDVPLGSQPKKELTSASYFIIFQWQHINNGHKVTSLI